MTLVSEIIKSAYREDNIIPLGRDPNTNEQSEGLARLQSIVSSVFGDTVGEDLVNWPIGNYGRSTPSEIPVVAPQLYYPQINSRVIAVNEEAQTVYLPVAPSDGARIAVVDPFGRLASVPITLDGNGRTIENAATLTLDTNSLNRTWLYRADLADWARVTDIALAGEMPFPSEFDDFFILMLALRINPRMGHEMADESRARLKQQQRQITARYCQSAPLHINTEIAFPTLQSYDNFADAWLGGSTDAWNRGGGGWW